MEHCKTCRRWVYIAGTMECASIKLSGPDDTRNEPDTLTSSHGDESGAYLGPGPEFGCVHHEAKE